MPHSEKLPVPNPPAENELNSDSDSNCSPRDDDYQADSGNSRPRPFNQGALHYLIRNLDLSKEKAELLGSRLKQRNIL